jgi:hypothetical protein
MHCRRGLIPWWRPYKRFRPGSPSSKKRVTMPDNPEAPYALANVTGCPEGITARRTPGALL